MAIESTLLYALFDLFDLFDEMPRSQQSSLSRQLTEVQLQEFLQTRYFYPSTSSSRLYMYADRLQICPIKMFVSFRSTAQYPITDTLLHNLFIPKGIKSIIDMAGNLITNLDQAPIVLNQFVAKNVYISVKDLLDKLLHHYILQARLQFMSLIGAVNVLGNPAQFVSSLSQGLKAFFNEPIIGMKKGGKEFVEGVGKGTKQLVSKTTYGFFNSVGKIVDTLGNGVETLTKSESYKQDRAAGKSGLIHGVKSGVNGIIRDFKDPKRDVLNSVVGIVTKPLGGLLDDTSHLIDKVKDITNTEVFPMMVRLPRCIGFDVCLQPYSLYTAIGMKYMCILIRKEVVNLHDKYVIHCPVNQGALVLFFTTQCLLVIDTKTNRVTWKEPYPSVSIFGIASHCILARKVVAHTVKISDCPITCVFNNHTLFNLVQAFIKLSCKDLGREEFMQFSNQVSICVQRLLSSSISV